MATLQPEQALLLRDVFLEVLKREHGTTRAVIDAIPVDKGGYQPDAIVKSADDLAWHIVSAEHRFLEAVANGAFDFADSGRPAEMKTSADISRWYGEAFARDVERIAAMRGDALARTIDFRGMFQMPAVRYLHTAQMHSVHHRGQLSMYLRPMGAKVPGIYGPSYDTAQAIGGR